MKKPKVHTEQQEQLVERLTRIPSLIVEHHDNPALSRVVLAEICQCFGIERSAYFVDNPDFDHFVGAAGYDRNDVHSLATITDQPPSQLHDAVQQLLETSQKRKNTDAGESEILKQLAQTIGIANPAVMTWDMKHGNHGVLVFEPELPDTKLKELFKRALSLLGLCPINR